jgi:hypothetical protein
MVVETHFKNCVSNILQGLPGIEDEEEVE